jgi:hypothetical protein
MNPVSPLGLILGPTVDGEASALADAGFDLGAGFALDQAGRALLERAVAFDAMGFPFPVDLEDRVRASAAGSGLERFILADRTAAARTSLARASLAVALAGTADDRILNHGRGSSLDQRSTFTEQQRGESPAPHLAFETEPAPNVTLFASLNGSAGTSLGLDQALAARRLDLIRAETTLTPFDRLGGPVAGGGLALKPHDGLDVAISAYASLADDQSSATSLQKIELAQTLRGDLELRLGLGLLQQESGFLGTSASGAFGDHLNSRSTFADLSLVVPVTDDIDWFAGYSRGAASITSGGGLLGDWSEVQADAFATGLSIRNLRTERDGLTLMIGQPFRAARAKATLTVPVGRTEDGAVVTERRRVDLEPAGREITSEATYRWSLDADHRHQIQAGAFARFNPDHDRDTPPDFGLALRYRHPF